MKYPTQAYWRVGFCRQQLKSQWKSLYIFLYYWFNWHVGVHPQHFMSDFLYWCKQNNQLLAEVNNATIEWCCCTGSSCPVSSPKQGKNQLKWRVVTWKWMLSGSTVLWPSGLSKRNLERSRKTGSRACNVSMNCWGMQHDNIIKSHVSLQWHTKPAEFKTA